MSANEIKLIKKNFVIMFSTGANIESLTRFLNERYWTHNTNKKYSVKPSEADSRLKLFELWSHGEDGDIWITSPMTYDDSKPISKYRKLYRDRSSKSYIMRDSGRYKFGYFNDLD